MKKIDVLIVEDDESIRELYRDALVTQGMEVLTAATGNEGVTVALAKKPKVILMDIMMPDINGHEAVKKIRQDQWGKQAKIIFLTNRTDAENIVTAVEEGSDDYIIKAHTELKELVNRVRLVMHAEL